MNLGDKILLLRKKAGLSQEDLANQLDVSRQTVYKWESGNATPEIDKIKTLTKLFSVSFDYLMNDEVLSTGPVAMRQRKVFSTGKELEIGQADIDNGILPERKGRLDYNTHFSDGRKVTIEALNEIGATDVLYLHPQANIAYFYDAQKKVFGFYYAWQVQFVCPIENFLGIEFGGGGQRATNSTTRVGMIGVGVDGINSVGVGAMPTVDVENNLKAWMILSYREGADVKEFQMNFDLADRYVIDFFKGDGFEIEWAKNMESLLKNLKTLQFKLTTLQSVETGISLEELPDLDCGFYETKNVQLAVKYQKYLEDLAVETKADNKEDLIAQIGLYGGLGAVIIGCLIWILSIL